MVGLRWSLSCALKTDIQKRANGSTYRPLEMSLIASVRPQGNNGRPLRHKLSSVRPSFARAGALAVNWPAKCRGKVMKISDLRTRVDALNERSRLVTRNAQPDSVPAVTLLDTAARSDGETNDMPDPLIQALVDKLPIPNTIWSIEDRAKWLRAAAILFNLVYRTDGDEQKQPAHEGRAIPDSPSVLKSDSAPKSV